MTLLVSYDISNSKIRKKISDLLIAYGLLRIQKSVFIGYLRSDAYKNKMESSIRQLIARYPLEKEDKIMYLPIHYQSFHQATFIGEIGPDFIKEVTGRIKILIC